MNTLSWYIFQSEGNGTKTYTTELACFKGTPSYNSEWKTRSKLCWQAMSRFWERSREEEVMLGMSNIGNAAVHQSWQPASLLPGNTRSLIVQRLPIHCRLSAVWSRLHSTRHNFPRDYRNWTIEGRIESTHYFLRFFKRLVKRFLNVGREW